MYEKVLKTIIALGGAATSYLFGGWNALIAALLFLIVVDYLTGMIAAGINGKLSSSIGFRGIAKKVFIFLIVAIAHKVDVMLGDAHMFRDATIFFYIANELLSIIENGGVIGVPIPTAMKKAVAILKDKGGVE